MISKIIDESANLSSPVIYVLSDRLISRIADFESADGSANLPHSKWKNMTL
jgi:hypothetical protein